MEANITDLNPSFYQFVGHDIFKQLIRIRHPIVIREHSAPPALTYHELNGLRYAAGYIPRMLRKKLVKSTHPLKEDIILCIHDLLDEGDEEEEEDETQDWVHAINRGGAHSREQCYL